MQPAARTRLRETLAHWQAEKSFFEVHALGKNGFKLFFALRGEKSEGVPSELPGKTLTVYSLPRIMGVKALEGTGMKDGKLPNPDTVHHIPGYGKEIYVKPTITNPNILVGEFTYIADAEFESHVTHFYPWSRDKLIIGKFCQIAAGVEFVMNDANHQMNAASTFPFYTLEGWNMEPPAASDMPFKGNTVIGNDVWIGQNAVILPGVHIGDGAVIGANSVVGCDVAPYTIMIGNPARLLRHRFDEELTGLLLRFKWWDKSIEEINALIPILTSSDLQTVRAYLKEKLK